MTEYRVAADVGGTFTDLVMVVDGDVRVKKMLSTPPRFNRGVIDGIKAVLDESGLGGEALTAVVHATTVGSNTVATLSGATTGLLTTKGFGDVLEIGRMSLPVQNDLSWRKKVPPVERWLVRELDERVAAHGEIVRELDLSTVRDAAAELVEGEGARSIAVSLINSYANPRHERVVAEIIAEHFPDVSTSLSCEVNPEIAEYERTITTVIDAYVKPTFDEYLRELEDDLRALRYGGRLFIMQSNGGVMTSEIARTRPSYVLESGPVAGVIGVQKWGEKTGGRNFISFDMGGTTAKCAIVDDLTLDIASQMEIDRGPDANRFLPGSGYLLRLPTIELMEIGSGGGSIAWVDSGGVLQVGPQSAGADPGPVCYDLGGTRVTQTDANVILGYLNPDYLVGGDLKLNALRAAETLQATLAEPLGMSVVEAAYGIYAIANAKMTRMVKAVTTEKGRNPADYAMVAFGGCGPGHALAIAEELGVELVIVPPGPGLFSSFGLHFADVEQHRTWTYWCRLSDLDYEKVNSWFGVVEDETLGLMGRQGLDAGKVEVSRIADMRYAGQGSELSIALPLRPLDRETVEELRREFSTQHEASYGYGTDEPVEIFRLRLVAKSVERPPLPTYSGGRDGSSAAAGPTFRRAYFGPDAGWIETPVLGREDLSRLPVRGPLIVEEYDATTVVLPGWRASVDHWGNIVTERGEPAPKG